jgi:hypothetical protein
MISPHAPAGVVSVTTPGRQLRRPTVLGFDATALDPRKALRSAARCVRSPLGQSSNAARRGGAQPVCLFLRTTGTCPTLAPLCRSHAFRKYDSTCLAVVSAQLCKPTTSGNGSGKVHCLAARKTDVVRFDVFAVHQPQCQFFNRAARCSKENTNPLARDEARRIAVILPYV